MTDRQKTIMTYFGCATRALLLAAFYLAVTLVICLHYGQRDWWYVELPIATLFLYSTARTATFGDRELRSRLDGKEVATHRGTLAFLLRDTEGRIELVTLLLTVLLLPIDFGICSIGGLFFRSVPYYALRRLLMLATALPFILPAWYLGRRSALIRLAAMPHYERLERRALLPHLLSYLGAAALYFIGAYTLMVAMSGVRLTVKFALMAPLIALAFFALWLALHSVQYIRVFRARRRLYRRVRGIAKRNGYTVTRQKGLYRSVLLQQTEPHFSVTAGEHTYDCRVLSSVRKAQNFFFAADGILTASPAAHGGLLALFSLPFSVRTPYAFESEHRKVLIVTPAVWHWYISEGTSREVDIGAWVFGYKLYNASSFLRILEREGLDEDFSKG